MRWILPVLLLTSCAKGSLPVDISKFAPRLSFQDVEVESIDFRGMDTQFVFAIDNPNPVGLSVASFTYDLDLGGNGFVDGDSADGLALPAGGTADFMLPVNIVFADVIALVSNLGDASEVPFSLQGEFGFQTPLGILKVPYQEEGMLPVLRAPKVQLQGVRVDSFRPLQNSAVLAVDIDVTSKGGNELSLRQFDYGLSLAGESVATGLVQELATVGAGETQTVTLPIELNLLGLGSSIVTAIRDKGPLQVGLTAGTTVGTPFGPLPFNVDEQASLRLQ